jgi:signal transduction histidine kinase
MANSEDLSARRLTADPRVAELVEELRTRDEFIANLVHCVRNPLTPVYLLVRNLASAVKDSPQTGCDPQWLLPRLAKLQDSLDSYVEALDRFEGIGLAESARASSERKLVDLAEVVRGVAATMDRQFASVGVELRTTTRPVTGVWDRILLEHVCFNLLSVALHFGTGQPVDLSVSGDVGKARLTVTMCTAGEEARALWRHLDAPEPQNGGLGVNLWVARRLTERLDGEMLLDRRAGRPTVVSVTLQRSI